MEILTRISRHPNRASCSVRDRRSQRVLLCALLVTAMRWMVETSASVAEEPMPSEYAVKAAFLVNFPKYAEWPAGTFAAADSPIVIAVLGETNLTRELQKVVEDRTVNGRKIILKPLASGEEPGACHILFISAAEQQRSPELLARLKEASILTVGESNDFLERGGMINLARRDQRIALEVNLTAAGNAGIKISSRLLSVASMVKGRGR